MSKQMQLMGEYVEKLQTMVGEAKASNIISNVFFSITVKANDFLSNYFVPLTNPRKIEFTIPEFQDFLINKLSEHIKVCMLNWILYAYLSDIICLGLQYD